MKLQNLSHIVIGLVCVGLLPNVRPLAAQSRRVDGAPLAPYGNVQQAWVARYHYGPGTYFDGPALDSAKGIALDSSGNIYVTGSSTGSGTDYDYATIKYNSAGQQQWVARYHYSGESTDFASAIAVDGSGNVYVTGTSGDDWATVKYNSAGQEQWLARYNGPGNGDDRAWAIAVDASGNVYNSNRFC
jgi:hypothetical protein